MAILELSERIRKLSQSIYCTDVNIYSEIHKLIPEIQNYYLDFISLIPKLNEIGMNISHDGIISQLKNLLEAIANKDRVKLFDILSYEINDTLLFYNEIYEVINGK